MNAADHDAARAYAPNAAERAVAHGKLPEAALAEAFLAGVEWARFQPGLRALLLTTEAEIVTLLPRLSKPAADNMRALLALVRAALK